MEALLSGSVSLDLALLCSAFRGRFYDGNKERAVVDLATDFLTPRVPAAQLALVEPDLYSGRLESVADPLRRLSVLRGVA
jgi:hypothetical protein